MANRSDSPVPDGMHTVTMQLFFNGEAGDAVTFYGQAFDADVRGEVARTPDGNVMHALLGIGDTHIMLADAWPGGEHRGPSSPGGSTAAVFLYVDDCDAWFERAVGAGCTVRFPIQDMFWGDRVGTVKDPFGHAWSIASHRWDYTAEEIEAGQTAWLSAVAGPPAT